MRLPTSGCTSFAQHSLNEHFSMSTAASFDIAPPRHSHAHDVGTLEAWMESVSREMMQETSKALRRQDASAGSAADIFSSTSQTVVDSLYFRARKLTVFNNELARQAAVHCPRVAR